MEKIHNFCNIVWEIIIINLILFALILLGGGILGWSPGVVATFTVIKDRLKNKDTGILNIIKKMFCIYKKEFKKSNILGNIFLVLILILSINILNFKSGETLNIKLIYGVTQFLRAGTVVFALISFSIYSFYEMSIKDYFKKTLLIMLVNPQILLILIVWCWLNSKIIEYFPKIAFFSIGYIFFYGVLAINYQFLKRNSLKQGGDCEI